ncbi:glutathione S-transferase family protein [Stakelama tenebrarum]|uniref:glutathione transferase n=1 Tax=Stakelama tenebrarum TaxID=2711215 RepID=A0A6G6Y5A6_9SPHN|nr:glutathione S-transferase [Sphingosinithalassobacter tenebrarum]QIG80031.1 glutathione S-transferase [Sphingosinithalassobacter tenebrarum]
MITVHHLENSRSQRILWLLEELAIPYEVVRYARDKKTMLAPPSLKRVHPLGKSPVITDSSNSSHSGPRVVPETGAIIEYLVEKADGKLGPPSHRESALRYRHFLHYAEGSLMPPLLVKLALGMVPLFGKMGQKRIQPMIDVHLDWIETELAERPWFAGDEFTASDVMMSFPLEAAVGRAGATEGRPHIAQWLKTIHARPAYQAALTKGGPYAYA